MENISQQQAQQEREKYVSAFNDTMLKIWQEQITLLDVIDTRQLLASPRALPVRADGRFFEVGLSQMFLEYGLWQDYGTGRELQRNRRTPIEISTEVRQTPRGNSGDIGRDKVRQRRRWFSKKYFSSVMNIRDFFADNLGKEFQGIIADSFDDKIFRRKHQ